ncbi:MAG: ion transporter [Alphaproteobacteria bacterium]|nr:MAG: ion transporter [Alphaproteobacteria bacterium]
MSIRKEVWETLEVTDNLHLKGRWVDLALMTLILLNVVAVSLESVRPLYEQYSQFFDAFDAFSVTVFTIEYIGRVWSCVERAGQVHGLKSFKSRLAYMMTPLALIDLLAIAPFYLAALIPGLDLRFLRVIRIMRIFKLTRYSKAVAILLNVLSQERRAFGAAIVVLAVVAILAASGIYLFEHRAQPEYFGSIPESLWWSVVTLTTVGYGDVTPITLGGKIFGGIVAVVGVGMIALPAGILASGFVDELRRRERQYEFEVARALEDGIITPRERRKLEKLRNQLGLPEDPQHALDKEAALQADLCPLCGQSLAVEEAIKKLEDQED